MLGTKARRMKLFHLPKPVGKIQSQTKDNVEGDRQLSREYITKGVEFDVTIKTGDSILVLV